MFTTNTVKTLIKINNFSYSSFRNLSSGMYNNNPQTTKTTIIKSPAVTGDVPGLSSAVLQVTNKPVGPGASKDSNYKNPEYFCYNQSSYYEAEIEMLKYRCPQPSAKK